MCMRACVRACVLVLSPQYMNIGQPPPQQYYTAVPVVAGTATAPGGYGATAPAPASYSAAFPPQHGMAPSQPQAGKYNCICCI